MKIIFLTLRVNILEYVDVRKNAHRFAPSTVPALVSVLETSQKESYFIHTT